MPTSSQSEEPFHVSRAFRIHPARWRWEFIIRNPVALDWVREMLAIQAFAMALPESVGAAYQSEGFNWGQVQPLSEEVVSIRQCLRRLGWRLARTLEERYGIVFSGPCLGDPRYGPPSAFFGLTRGVSPEESGDIWFDAYCASQGNREMQRAVLAAWETLVMETAGGWDHPRVQQLRTLATMNVRQRRRCLSLLSRVCSQFSLPKFYRHEDSHYQRALQVWDAREGWTGEGYDAARAEELRMAKQRSEATAQDYYRAFNLVMGEPYSRERWDATLGARHRRQLGPENYQRMEAHPGRRRTGRTKGQRQRAPGEVTLRSPPAVSSLDPSERLEQQELCEQLRQFQRRVQKGVSVEIAAAEVELPADFRQELTSRGGLEQLMQFFARTNFGNEEG
jgi:hypothetical protein